MHQPRARPTPKHSALRLGDVGTFLRAFEPDGGFGGAKEVLSLVCLLPDLRTALRTPRLRKPR